jgi:UPF0755 protein
MRRLGILALLAIATLGAVAGWLESQISRSYRGHRPERVFVDIPRGTSRWGVAGILRRDDVIRNQLAFMLFSVWHFRSPLQAGEYLFDHPLNSRDAFWKIAHGQIYVHIIIVPEGWTMFDIATELEQRGVCSRADFLIAAHDTSVISDLAPQATTVEGFLFPSTYQFTRRATCDQVVKRMVQNFRAVWEAINASGQARNPAGLTPAQLVTLASLVERETPDAEERPVVAGVFYNRLQSGDPLQCDPTVQYALEMTGHSKRDVRAADLQIDSPYNTYKHRGLPPGPIANPGQASLQAALAPATTDYLYFVANDEGGHFFSRTLAEHNRNVARLRQSLAADARASDPTPKKAKP